MRNAFTNYSSFRSSPTHIKKLIYLEEYKKGVTEVSSDLKIKLDSTSNEVRKNINKIKNEIKIKQQQISQEIHMHNKLQQKLSALNKEAIDLLNELKRIKSECNLIKQKNENEIRKKNRLEFRKKSIEKDYKSKTNLISQAKRIKTKSCLSKTINQNQEINSVNAEYHKLTAIKLDQEKEIEELKYLINKAKLYENTNDRHFMSQTFYY